MHLLLANPEERSQTLFWQLKRFKYICSACPKNGRKNECIKEHFERDTLAQYILKEKYSRSQMKEETLIEQDLNTWRTYQIHWQQRPLVHHSPKKSSHYLRSYATLVNAFKARVDDVKMDFEKLFFINNRTKTRRTRHFRKRLPELRIWWRILVKLVAILSVVL